MGEPRTRLRRVAIACIGFAGSIVALTALFGLYLGVVWLRLPAVDGLEDAGDPGPTAFMKSDACQAHQRSWLGIDEIDPRIGCAVVHTEDRRFFAHDGVDTHALQASLRRNWKARSWRYGGSTITMQLARNLFLSRSRTFTRKIKEIILARRLTRTYTRRRLLELYLNSAELAPCVYGVEAAAQHYFGHSARVLDPAEVAFLATMLPRPSTPPGVTRKDRSGLIRRQKGVLKRLWNSGLLLRHQLLEATNRLEARWRSGWRNAPRKVSRSAPQHWYDRKCIAR